MGAKAGIVSFDVVFPPCFGDFHLFEVILHPTAADTSISVMVLEVSGRFWLNYIVVTIICCVSVSHNPSFNVLVLPSDHIDKRESFYSYQNLCGGWIIPLVSISCKEGLLGCV